MTDNMSNEAVSTRNKCTVHATYLNGFLRENQERSGIIFRIVHLYVIEILLQKNA